MQILKNDSWRWPLALTCTCLCILIHPFHLPMYTHKRTPLEHGDAVPYIWTNALKLQWTLSQQSKFCAIPAMISIWGIEIQGHKYRSDTQSHFPGQEMQFQLCLMPLLSNPSIIKGPQLQGCHHLSGHSPPVWLACLLFPAPSCALMTPTSHSISFLGYEHICLLNVLCCLDYKHQAPCLILFVQQEIKAKHRAGPHQTTFISSQRKDNTLHKCIQGTHYQDS